MKKYGSQGAALVQVLIVLLVLTLLGTFFLSLSSTEFWQGERDHKEAQAYYYAKSGTEAALQLFENGSQGGMPFFLHGSLAGLSRSDGTGIEGIDEDIVTLVTQSGDEVTFFSTGTYQGIKKTITYVFSFTGSGGGPGGSGGTPDVPPVGPPDDDTSEGVSGDPVADGGIGWYDSDGELTSGSPIPSDKPVVFESPDESKPFIYKDDNSAIYWAPAMYFLNFPDSLVIRDNMELRLNTNFIYFAGDVNGVPANNENNNGMLTLRVYDSEIYGNLIGGNSGYRYGVVYIGGRLKNTDSNETGYLSGDADKGYYYFQEGINLVGDTIESNIVQRKLIRLDGDNDDALAYLNYEIATSGGIGDGQYK